MVNFMRILATVSYNGTNYQGWQKQPNAITVQETIEKDLSKFFNQPVTIYGAGRTDAGVHALGQKFHFDIEKDSLDLDRLIYSLNCMLPADIKIEDMEEVEPDFHARFSAKEKVYGYSIILDSKDVLFYNIMYTCPYDINPDILEIALTHFIGTYNFKNFTSKETDKDNFVRTIYDIKVNRSEKEISVTLRGNGFMRYMIRFIIGTAIQVALGNEVMETIDELLDEKSERKVVSWKAPANGLILLDVLY